MSEVIICGAGWAGLNAARTLRANGHNVSVLELTERVGGRVKSEVIDGFTIDHGFQVINPRYSELKESGVLAKVTITELPKGLDIRSGFKTIRVGDFRRNLAYLPGDLSSSSGTFREKLNFLRYLRAEAADITFGEAMTEVGAFYDKTLRPFLAGVLLADPSEVANRAVSELIHWLIKGAPGVPVGGVKVVSEELAAGLDIKFGEEVIKVTASEVLTNNRRYEADAVILALDPVSSARLLDEPIPPMNYSESWYFSAPKHAISSKHLRVGGVGPVINTIALSNVAASYAPPDRTLIVATALSESSEAEIRNHLSYQWEVDTREWEVISIIKIPNSLPLHRVGQELIRTANHPSGVFVAGDWINIPAQQGALLSGRLAARAVIDSLAAR